MPIIRYRRTPVFLPQLGRLYSVHPATIECSRQRFRPFWDWNDEGDSEPIDYLCERATLVADELIGDVANARSLRNIFRDAAAFREQVLEFIDRKGQEDFLTAHISRPVHCLDAHLDFLSALWSKGATTSSDGDDDFGVQVDDRQAFLSRHYAIASLGYVELTKLATDAGSMAVANHALRAERALRLAVGYSGTHEARLRRELRREMGLKGAAQRYRTDPKQQAKAAVHARWLKWAANEERYPSIARFAHSMLTDFPILENTQTVERWVRQWRRERRKPLAE